MQYSFGAYWADYAGHSEDDFVGAMERIFDYLFDGAYGYVADSYDGDHKNPPHVVIKVPSNPGAKYVYDEVIGMENNPSWGWFTQLQGNEIYIEPYA